MKLRYCLSFQCPIFLHITGGVWVVFIRHCLRVSGWCLEFVWELRRSEDVSIPNPLAKANNRYCPNKYPIMHIKRLCVGLGVSMVPEGVWMMPRLCLRVFGKASIPNLLGNRYIKLWYSDIAFSSSALYCIKLPMSWGVWIVSGSVWMGSEGVWRCINTKYFGKNLYRSC